LADQFLFVEKEKAEKQQDGGIFKFYNLILINICKLNIISMLPNILPTTTSAKGCVSNKVCFSFGKWHERKHMVDSHLPNTL
jgi:hypothetical protein